MVLLEGINDDEFDDFMEFVRGNRNLILQVIELMDFHDCKFHGDVDGVERDLNTRAEQIVTRRMHHRRKYCLDNAEVEVVRPLHNTEFCGFCNRLRVTSDGKLKPCLLRSDNLIPIRGKHGEDLEAAFREAVSLREPLLQVTPFPCGLSCSLRMHPPELRLWKNSSCLLLFRRESNIF